MNANVIETEFRTRIQAHPNTQGITYLSTTLRSSIITGLEADCGNPDLSFTTSYGHKTQGIHDINAHIYIVTY